MANSRPTLGTIENACQPRKTMGKVWSLPSVIFDPEVIEISHVFIHSASTGLAQYMTVQQATEKNYVEIVLSGNHHVALIKTHYVQLVFRSSESLLKALAPPKPADHRRY
ncbi:hypothetical protein [uncultured Desulfosarcina sp.]|uniref:hypothetical protein n=1 Tax=uncultured Desulfosarcina sp. TaxID=218289 RepID=UPI0029C8C595|nr:hypothetical protein [uncultured Desulfosarcina sp.]